MQRANLTKRPDNAFRQKDGRVTNGAIKRGILYTLAMRPTVLFIIPCLTALFMNSGGKHRIVNETITCCLTVSKDARLCSVAIYGLFIWRETLGGINTLTSSLGRAGWSYWGPPFFLVKKFRFRFRRSKRIKRPARESRPIPPEMEDSR